MHGSIWQVVDTREGADFGGTAARVHTVLRQHRDTDVVRNPAPLCDPNMLIPDPAIRSPRRLPFSAIVRPPRHRLHRVLERAGCMNITLLEVRRCEGIYKEEIDQEIRISTYLLTYFLPSYLRTIFYLFFTYMSL